MTDSQPHGVSGLFATLAIVAALLVAAVLGSGSAMAGTPASHCVNTMSSDVVIADACGYQGPYPTHGYCWVCQKAGIPVGRG